MPSRTHSSAMVYIFTLLTLVGLTLALSCSAQAAALPTPHQRSDEPTIGPAPEPVMEQVFWLQLPVPPETPVTVRAPTGVTLLDRTKPGGGRTHTRLYFRSNRGIDGEAIRIDVAGRPSEDLPLRVLTYRQDIERHIKAVPGVDPNERKRSRSYYTNDLVAVARQNLREFPKLAERVKARNRYDAMTDEQIFARLPSWNVPRDCYSNWPCPFCGDKIYKSSAFYPWQRSATHPFKAKCPSCKRLFPTNDFANDDFTSGEFPDDGWGWDPGSGEPKDFAAWVAYYNHHTLWQTIARPALNMGLRYLLFGDEQAAHKVGVLLARMAYVYPGMNCRWQQVRPAYWGRRGRLLLDGNWERNNILVPICRAYDAVCEHIGKDTALVEFLRTKDPAIRSPEDVKALIDTYLIQVFGWDWIRRELTGGNMGAREEDMAQFAVCADMGPVSDRWIEELFTHAYSSGLNKGGFDDETLINTMTREGPCWISALGYAFGYVRSKTDMAEILSRVTSPRWQARCNLYDERLYPKFRAEFHAWIDFVIAGQFGPSYGDSGNPWGARYPKGIPKHLRVHYECAYRHWPTDKLAHALYRLGRGQPGLFELDIWPQIEAQATAAGQPLPLESRVMDGVGFVFLESRPHARDQNDRAGIALRYGYGRGHHHHDNLNIEMFAKGVSIAPELGYPCWAHPLGNTTHVAHHNTGMIDRSNQHKGCISRGDLEIFATAPGISFADVSAQPDGFPNHMYRRAVCLVDAPGGNVYLLDVLRLSGGKTRTYCFHGPPHDGFDSNLSFGAKSDTPFKVRGANNILHPQQTLCDGQAWADWQYKGKPLRLRLTFLGGTSRRYFTALCGKPDIPGTRYLFAEEEAESGATEFVAIWQPYDGEPFIRSIERLAVDVAGGFRPAAIRVTLAGGRTDTFLYTHHPTTPIRCDDLELKGSFAYWSEANGGLRAAHLVNGEYLRRGDEALRAELPPFRAKIMSVNYTERSLKLDRPLPRGAVAKGELIYIQAGFHRTAYHVMEVMPTRDEVRLDLNAIIYRSKMLSIAPDRKHVVCELPPPIEKARGFKPGYYDGTTLTGESGQERYRVTKAKGERVYLDRPVEEGDLTDKDDDGRRVVSIYDYGPGDEVTMYWSAFVRRD